MIKKTGIITLFLIIFLLGAYLRVRHLTSRPGWFRDEGTYFEASRSLMLGKSKVGALNCTFASPFLTHPPLFFYLNSIWFKIFRPDFQSFRRFSVSCNLLIMIVLFLIATRMEGLKLGFLSLSIFTFHPLSVLFSRMALPYHLYSLFGVLLFYSILNIIDYKDYSEDKNLEYRRMFKRIEQFWLIIAIISASLALFTVYYAFVFIIFIGIILFLEGKKRQLLHLLIIPVPIVAFFLISLMSSETGFIEDAKALFLANKSGSAMTTLQHYREFFSMGVIFILGSVGLLFFKNVKQVLLISLMFFLALHVVLRKEDTIISFINYPIIPLLPFLSIGLAKLILYLIDYIKESIIWKLDISHNLKISIHSLVIFFLILLFLPPIRESFRSIQIGFKSTLDFGMTKNQADSYQTAGFLNANTKKDSVVLCTSTLWWLLSTERYSDISQALAYQGIKSDFYLYPISKDRFLFNPSISEAMFVVEDGFTDARSGQFPGAPPNPIKVALEQVRNNWLKVKVIGEYRIYLNPIYQPEFQKIGAENQGGV